MDWQTPSLIVVKDEITYDTLGHKMVWKARRDELKEDRAPEKEKYSLMLKGNVFEDKKDWISILNLPFIDWSGTIHWTISKPQFPLHYEKSNNIYFIGLLDGFNKNIIS